MGNGYIGSCEGPGFISGIVDGVQVEGSVNLPTVAFRLITESPNGEIQLQELVIDDDQGRVVKEYIYPGFFLSQTFKDAFLKYGNIRGAAQAIANASLVNFSNESSPKTSNDEQKSIR